MVNQYVNYILAFSNILGFFPFIIALKKKKIMAFFLLSIIFFSSLHHLTEKNEMGHSLEGIKIYGLENYSSHLRKLDMFFAYSFFIYLLLNIGLFNILFFIIQNKILIIIVFSLSFICDYLLFDKPNTYLFFHFFWHTGIYYIIYKIFCIYLT